VIRGDDHLSNAARQTQIYDAMGWKTPVWAHISRIHGPDGKKLSKRHGALGIEDYAEMGYPAPAVRNYLARLGWSHGDDEFFDDAQAKEWFDFVGIGKAPARLDLKKLEHVSGQHIAVMPDDDVLAAVQHYLKLTQAPALSASEEKALSAAMYCLKPAARTLPQLIDKAQFVLSARPITPDEKASKALDTVSIGMLNELTPQLQNASWTRDGLEAATAAITEAHGVGFGKLASPMRAALAGRAVTPSVFDMMLVLGRDETLARLSDAVTKQEW